MQSPDPIPTEELLQRLCDGGLTADQRSNLREVLRTSPGARQSYIEYVSLHFWLRERFARMLPVDEPNTTAQQSLPARLPGDRPQRWRLRSWRLAAVLAASLAVVASLAYWGIDWSAPVAAPHANHASVAAMVVAVDQCLWGNGNQLAGVGDVLRAQQVVDVRSGLTQLRFDSGARVTLQGPCRVEITSSTHCKLLEGALVARLDKSLGSGFAVTSGAFRVVDLGTEFGVRRVSANDVELEVFDGEIAVYDTTAPSTSFSVDPLGKLSHGEVAHAVVRSADGTKSLRKLRTLQQPFAREIPAAAEHDMQPSQVVAEGFSQMGNGRRLSGVHSGIGWQSPWQTDNVAFQEAEVIGFAGRATSTQRGNASVHRPLPRPFGKDELIYASARFSIEGPDTICTAWVLLFQQQDEPGAGESNLAAFGISDRKFSARLASATRELTQLPASKWSGDFGEYLDGEEHLLVVKLEFDVEQNRERLSLWIDPSASEPSHPDHVATRDTGRSGVDCIAVRFWEMDGDTQGYVDDLRIGPTWQSVVR